MKQRPRIYYTESQKALIYIRRCLTGKTIKQSSKENTKLRNTR